MTPMKMTMIVMTIMTMISKTRHMKQYLLLLMLAIAVNCSIAQTTQGEDITQLKKEVSTLRQQLGTQKSLSSSQQRKINSLQADLGKTKFVIDSLQAQVEGMRSELSSTEEKLGSDITKANQSIEDNTASLKESISTKSIIGFVIVLLVAAFAAIGILLLRKKLSNSESAIDAVRDAQKKLEEESVKLDNQLIDVLNNQLNSMSVKQQTVPVQPAAPDHSLVLKVADEITRIELNLSRMDPSVKGLKQLAKGVERIKNNYLSKGYEIADMLNKPYNEGMRINADFVLDENLEPGTRIITSITKPQVIYNGELIQKAIVTVTQNI